MKLKYRIIPKGAADGTVPLNWAFIDKKDILEAGLTDLEACKVIGKDLGEDCAAVWFYHAKDDPAVSYDLYGATTLEALDEAGVEYNATIYEPGEIFYPSAHFAWTPAYADSEMRTWLFEQSK